MASKLDYLSKYTSGTVSQDTNPTNDFDTQQQLKKDKKKKKKKDKKKKNKHESSRNVVTSSTTLVIDDDNDFGNEDDGHYLAPEKSNVNQDMITNEDDPMVVDPGELTMEVTSFVNNHEARGSKTRHKEYHSHDNNDSEDSEKNNRKKKKQNRRRRRYDSDDDNGSDDDDDDDDAKGRSSTTRRRHDSDDDDDDDDDNEVEKVQRRRYDSDDEISNDGFVQAKQSSTKRKRRRQRMDSSSESEGESSDKKMSSGHKAGLQSSSQFKVNENEIQKKKKQSRKNMSDRGETVYRGKDGKKVDASAASYSTKQKPVTEDIDINTGRVQMQKMQELFDEKERLKQGSFARSINDADQYRKEVLREGDPMATAARQKGKESNKKRVYKGPKPKPNRFGIPPGYRWDGVDRGNGFEDKVLTMLYSRGVKKENHYKWSCSDM